MIFWALTGAAVTLFLAMMVLTVPTLLTEAAGMLPFDLRPWGYSVEAVQSYLVTISEEGLATYLGPQHQLDLIFPLVLAMAFITGFRRFLGPVGGLVMTVVAVAGAVADYSENALVAAILTEPATVEQVTLASAMTIAKWLFYLVCLGVMAWIGVRAWRSRPRKTPKRKTGGTKRKAAPKGGKAGK
ncbi:hypothetical protein [Pseudooceanicola onchidii]|uniref:hypothetical protein n=1 Tax=Pseudooceanicola onchidii TaxID=2562279 RepID=UPI0010AAAB0B|nr:hypothetical protein [Pseudooceanicola onchidii]